MTDVVEYRARHPYRREISARPFVRQLYRLRSDRLQQRQQGGHVWLILPPYKPRHAQPDWSDAT